MATNGNGKKKRQVIDFGFNMRMYWSHLSRYKAAFFVILFILLAMETANVVEKWVFKALVDRGTLVAAGTADPKDFLVFVTWLAVAYIAIILVRSAGDLTRVILLNRMESKLIRDLKQRFFNHLVGLSHSFHTTNKTGSMISRLGRGAGAIENMTDQVAFSFAPVLFQLAAVLISLVYFDIIPAAVTLVVMILYIAYNLTVNNMQKQWQLRKNEAEDIEKAMVGDVFTNAESIKYFGKEALIKAKYAKLTAMTRDLQVKHWDFFGYMGGGGNLIIGFGTLFMLYWPVQNFMSGSITLGTLVFIYGVYGSLMSSLWRFVDGIRHFYRAMADFESLFQYAKIEQEVKDFPHAKPCRIVHPSIEFQNVSFSYKNRRILRNFSLKIPAHKTVAFVGPSGSGKTTLVKLLYRFYDVDKGAMLVGGKDIRSFQQESYRSELSIVPQECVLFDDTIYNNIKFSNPAASRSEVLRAMRLSQLDKIVKRFPQKENTVVGERGVKLSGGEKQRVSIARALLANKKILVLDEATSALDSDTEHAIQGALHHLLEGRTSIIIAHRLSTIMQADLIIVLDKGAVVQMGTHQKLIKEQGLYKHLWDLQKGGYIK